MLIGAIFYYKDILRLFESPRIYAGNKLRKRDAARGLPSSALFREKRLRAKTACPTEGQENNDDDDNADKGWLREAEDVSGVKFSDYIPSGQDVAIS
ncbi:hypothetical protein NPIL_307981 [Nephila pilipes]|uniref:Uncharacterized protein n=1 Tax=Nephila pilipes TaxID=299642 RepID=A0A8X6QZH2_NEPPI|nr:hypothetical protein NPIL_307981 [Nephila pilipes]